MHKANKRVTDSGSSAPTWLNWISGTETNARAPANAAASVRSSR